MRTARGVWNTANPGTIDGFLAVGVPADAIDAEFSGSAELAWFGQHRREIELG